MLTCKCSVLWCLFVGLILGRVQAALDFNNDLENSQKFKSIPTTVKTYENDTVQLPCTLNSKLFLLLKSFLYYPSWVHLVRICEGPWNGHQQQQLAITMGLNSIEEMSIQCDKWKYYPTIIEQLWGESPETDSINWMLNTLSSTLKSHVGRTSPKPIVEWPLKDYWQ